MDFRNFDIPKVTEYKMFELLTRDLLRNDDRYSIAELNGRDGQTQNGVDVYARISQTQNWIGAQCKVRDNNKSFSKQELQKEINLARSFNPVLSEYYLYTTLSRDSKTQKHVREIVEDLELNSEFYFNVFFWEDIEELLREKHIDIYYRYYPKFFKDNRTLGHAIGKLVNLHLQFEGKPDSMFELMIGRIPKYKNEKELAVDYFRETYYILNLNSKKAAILGGANDSKRIHTVPWDLVEVIENKLDIHRVSKWLNSLPDFDRFLFEDIHSYYHSTTLAERDRIVTKYILSEED